MTTAPPAAPASIECELEAGGCGAEAGAACRPWCEHTDARAVAASRASAARTFARIEAYHGGSGAFDDTPF